MTTRVLLLTLCVALTHATGSAQQKPDFSGDWVLNAEKSVFGPIPPPQCVGLTIAHREPEFVIEETGAKSAMCGLRLTYTIGGPTITYTTPATQDIIRDNMDQSPKKCRVIEGGRPR